MRALAIQHVSTHHDTSPASTTATTTMPTDPHGLALTPAPINRMVTLDYVDYSTTFKPSADIRWVSLTVGEGGREGLWALAEG